MKQVPLRNGGFALVDDEDFELVSSYSWYGNAPDKRYPRAFYAVANRYDPVQKKQPSVWMHRLILGAGRGVQVDHRDHNGLNNQRSNLRLCTQSLNNANARFPIGRSGFRGVFATKYGTFRASIARARHLGGRKMRHLGTFPTAEEAAKAYDDAARDAYGEFATLNFLAEKAA